MKIITQSKLFLGLFTVISGATQASHHFEAAQYLADTRVAQVDNFIFQSEKKDHTAVVMTVNYDPKKGDDQTFNSNAIYNMHFATQADLSMGKTLSVKFNQQRYTVYEIDSANPEPGTLGKKIGEGIIGQKSRLTDSIQSYAGIVEDPFYGNAIALDQFRKEILKGQYSPDIWKNVKGQNVFKDRKVGAIVLDLPNKMLGKEIFAFFTTDVKVNQQWKQVQYSAIPLLSHTVLFDNQSLLQAHDHSRPVIEYNTEIKPLIAANILRATTAAHSQSNPLMYAEQASNYFIPDVLYYKIGTPARFSAQKINGRSLDDDAMSVILTWLFGQETDQAISNTKKYTKKFPYVIPVK